GLLQLFLRDLVEVRLLGERRRRDGHGGGDGNTYTADVDPGRAREVTLAIAAEVRRDWRYATDALARAFRRERRLSSAERRDVAERVYGLIRMHRRVDAVCAWLLRPRGRRLGDLPDRDRDLLRYLVYRVTVEGAALAEAAPELARLGVEGGT